MILLHLYICLGCFKVVGTFYTSFFFTGEEHCTQKWNLFDFCFWRTAFKNISTEKRKLYFEYFLIKNFYIT